jgi:hypothetical protein
MGHFSFCEEFLALSEKATPVPKRYGRRHRFNGLNIKGLFFWESENLEGFHR